MRTLLSANRFAKETGPCVLAAGFFDGVHLGHQAVIAEARRIAAEQGAEAWALSFDQHPLGILEPSRRPPLLTPLPQRLEHLAATGLDGCLILPFTRSLAARDPVAFVQQLCEPGARIRAICCGANWRFGQEAKGNPETLCQLGERFGFQVCRVSDVHYAGRPVSSTRIRRAIRTGLLREAAAMLGRPYAIRDAVTRGRGQGRRMGMATANLHPGADVLPPVGVYVVSTWIGDRRVDGVANLGFRPTFEEAATSDPVLELHLLDFEGDLYGCILDIEFIERLRDEQRFPDPGHLRRQVMRDVIRARHILGAIPGPTLPPGGIRPPGNPG